MRTLTLAVLFPFFASLVGCSKLNSSAPMPGAKADPQLSNRTQNKGSVRDQGTKKDPAAEERAKLIGTWIGTDGEFQGIRMNPGSVQEMKWTFTNDKVSFTMLGKVMQATYTLQPTANPKTFDFKGPETAIQGIYELKGDTLKICCAATERPTAFATGGTSQDTIMVVFQKDNPAKKSK